MNTPRYIIDEAALVRNLEILKSVSERAGVRILLAQKAFSCTAVYPLCAKYLAGTTASSLFEAKHGHDNFGGETHVFAPAFIPEEMDELLGLVDHIVFNSPRQVALYGETARKRGVSVGLRVNPEVSVATTPAYDPCRPSSRLGTKLVDLKASVSTRDFQLSTLNFKLSSRGFCPNPHCPTNKEYFVEEIRLFLPDREAADPVGGKYCAMCGELLERACPNCGAPVHAGAICSLCGQPYISAV